MMKKVLIIPHHPGIFAQLKLRLIEIAKVLSLRYEVYLVNWNAARDINSFASRMAASLKDAIARKRSFKVDNLNIVEFPILHRPLFLVPAFNTFWLKQVINYHKIDIVINGSYYMFDIPEKKSFKYILDLADYPFSDDAFCW